MFIEKSLSSNKYLALEQAYAMASTALVQVIAENDELKTKQQELATKVSTLEEENANLKEQLLLMRQQIFGKKSEVGEPVVAPDPAPDNAAEPPITISGHTRRKPKKLGRNIDLSALPRHKIYHTLPEPQCCQCCNQQLIKIGQDISEQLEVLPMMFYVAEHIRDKYACRTCATIVMAPKPKAPIPKALAGGSLLAEVVVNKYQYHLPLYRQSKIFASHNAIIPDNTLGNWVMQAGAGLMPEVSDAMWQAVLAMKYLQVDETPVKMLKANKKGYLWTYFTPQLNLVIFEHSLTRSAAVAEKRLADFKGLLQTDGYKGYDKLRKSKNIVGFGCLTHARRKFKEILKITKNAPGIAAEFVSRVQPLYVLEEKMRQLELPHRTRKRLRQKQAFPVLKVLYPWLKQQFVMVPENSKLGKAIKYTLNQWPYIIAYLRHGLAEIDTNMVENKIRNVAIGKKNWLFMDNEDSGAINAFWFSLIGSAIINGLNPRVYIHFLLMKTHDIRRGIIDPCTVLPHTIDKTQLKAFAEEYIAMGKKIFDNSC